MHRVVHVERGVDRERVVLVDDRRIDPAQEQVRAALVRGAEREAVDRRQVSSDELRGIAVDQRLGREALRLGLVVRGQRGAARVADQDDALAAERRAHELHTRAEVLQHALHHQDGVVAGEARIEAEARDAARGEWRDQVVAHEVAGRVHDDRADAARARTGAAARRFLVSAVDARTQHLQPRLALHAPLPAARRSRRGGARAQASIAPQSETRSAGAARAPGARFSSVHAASAACASRAWRAVVSALAVGTVSSRRSPFGSKK